MPRPLQVVAVAVARSWLPFDARHGMRDGGAIWGVPRQGGSRRAPRGEESHACGEPPRTRSHAIPTSSIPKAACRTDRRRSVVEQSAATVSVCAALLAAQPPMGGAVKAASNASDLFFIISSSGCAGPWNALPGYREVATRVKSWTLRAPVDAQRRQARCCVPQFTSNLASRRERGHDRPSFASAFADRGPCRSHQPGQEVETQGPGQG